MFEVNECCFIKSRPSSRGNNVNGLSSIFIHVNYLLLISQDKTAFNIDAVQFLPIRNYYLIPGSLDRLIDVRDNKYLYSKTTSGFQERSPRFRMKETVNDVWSARFGWIKPH
jgi:hypothetical protein